MLDPFCIGWPSSDPDFAAVVDTETRRRPEAANFLASARIVYELGGRPTIAEADAIASAVSDAGVGRLVSVGAGLVMDAAKLAVYRNRERTGALLSHTAVPCGPEPYRAVAPFSMYDSMPGVRGGVQEPWLRPNEVFVVPDLLDRLDPTVVALFAGDSLVHAVESMLSRLTDADSERHATAAALVFAEQAVVSDPDRVKLVSASIDAALAFDTTKLGLAHALSRPMGIAAGISHDVYNLMLGSATVRFWGSETLAATALADVSAVSPTAQAWSDLIDGYRQRAGIPATLAESALTWRDIEAALEWAPNSSGIPNLPHPLRPGDLERLVRMGWGSGTIEADVTEGGAR